MKNECLVVSFILVGWQEDNSPNEAANALVTWSL